MPAVILSDLYKKLLCCIALLRNKNKHLILKYVFFAGKSHFYVGLSKFFLNYFYL